METQKTILIDGANTVMHNGFFIQDHIPRQLAKFIDDEYKIYLIYENYDDKDMWENSKHTPDWFKTTIILQDFDFMLKEKDNFSKKEKDTIVITKRPEFFKDFGFKILTYTSKFDKLNVADVIFCFGFSKLDFLRFCKESKLIGVYDSKFERIIITKLDYIPQVNQVGKVKYDAVAQKFYVDKPTAGNTTVKTYIALTDLDYFCNKSWTVSFNLNTKAWVSFHTYLPNFYIGENNFFYSGLNEGCDLAAVAVVEIPSSTTTTTTTATPLQCNLEGTAVYVS